MKVSMIVTGDKSINAALARLKGPQAKSAIRKAARTALRPVLDAVRRNQPRRTGRLARSAKLRAMKRSRSRIGAMVSTATDDARQAASIEFGYTTRKSKRGQPVKMTKVPGQEQLQRSAKSQESSAVQTYRQETVRWIEELGKP